MKFIFKTQQYQVDAVNAVVDVFKGQPFIAGEEYTRDLGEQKKTKVTAISIFDKEPSGQRLVEDDYDLGYSKCNY